VYPPDARLSMGTAPVFDAAADGLDREQPPGGIALLDAVHADAPNTEHPVLCESGTKPPRCGSACIAVARVQRAGLVDGHGADPRSDGSYRRTKVRKHATDTKVGQWAGDNLSAPHDSGAGPSSVAVGVGAGRDSGLVPFALLPATLAPLGRTGVASAIRNASATRSPPRPARAE
jgi:hypothetical protein